MSKKCIFLIISIFCFNSLQADEFQKFLEETRQKYKLPSLGGGATLHGKIVSVQVAGVRKFGSKVKVTVNDKYHIGSCTKSMTATIAGILVDQKKIKWESTIYEIFPEYRRILHKGLKDVTLTQLLSHTGGLPSLGEHHKQIWLDLYMDRTNKSAKKQRTNMIKKVLPLAPVNEPGTKFLYSNCGVSIAGMMLEKVSKKSWEELMGIYIAKPLDIQSLGFGSAPKSQKVDQPFPHIQQGGKTIHIDPRIFPDNPAAIAPAGTAHLSLIDFAKYTTIYSMKKKTLSPESFSTILTPILEDYALGWAITKRFWGGKVITHTGSNTMNYAVMWVAPEKEFSVVAVSNCGSQDAAKAIDEVCFKLIQMHLLKK